MLPAAARRMNILCQPSEDYHADDDTAARCGFKCLINRIREVSAVPSIAILRIAPSPKDHAQQSHGQVDGEYVV